ncbi:hypothetical protein GIV75_27955 [Pseudomonas sp. PA-3-5D]|uniref:hypothetical protein n=3 Tax=unclassified Pseudomonas TaxID=196821 RepID=UPI001F16C2C5|nr:hypothetical protein [Pseudomonas sp. PA-3-5D]MCF5564671.1 hypothetical protein [Pseudomonas sp. PA-3-5D]
MKTKEQEMNELILSYSVKSEHEVSKAIKTFADKTVALNKELGESESSINTLSIAGFKARNDLEALPAIEAQITALEAKQKAITEEIDHIKTATSRLSEIHVGKQIEKLLKKNKMFSVKAVEEMIKHSI